MSFLLKWGAGAVCLQSVVDMLVDMKTKEALEESELTDETKTILSQKVGEDSFNVIMALKGPPAIVEANENAPGDDAVKTEAVDLGWEKTGENFDDPWTKVKHVSRVREKISKEFTIEILATDDMMTELTFQERIKAKIYTSRVVFPLVDFDTSVDDETAKRVLDDLGYSPGKALPVTYNSDFDMLTDESFSRIFFAGMGSVLLVKQEKVSDSKHGPFVVDMPLQGLKIRDEDKFRSYGARIHFSADQVVTAIYDYAKAKEFLPNEVGWAAAKMLARTSAFLLMTAREHLIWTHFLVSNVAVREQTLHLPPNHPIRRLLTVFTFGATEVNINAFNTLVPNTCILHRSTALKYESLKDVFASSFSSSTIYEPFSEKKYNPALQKLIDEGKFPYASEGAEYYEVVRKFVKDWLDKAGDAATDKYATAFYKAMKATTKGQAYELPKMSEENAMVNMLSSIIFTVTAYHEIIGHVVDYTILPSKAGFRLTKRDPLHIDLQAFLYTEAVSASTSTRMPQLMNSFPNFFSAAGAPSWERDVWNTFQADLKSQSNKVQEDDAARDVEFKYFDPARFECSVSV
eukprot:CAMPEP_0113640780 /NCGR_PEP_ID=MMETSP0017_2-20120614/21405_1 /TAXON_ID=2856 /ORGANISM="Cylindrotheca closterium" /LENGTH=574 /DNA_ID=CAMNT_0000552083 /DNA_START=19 /DNA_END=1746 /DNA_ORIENTATION=- /assembly_acc=CAM_ASM_000147